MRRRGFLTTALVVAVSLLLVVPVGAATPRHSFMEGDFNVGVQTGEGVVPDVSWVATMQFGTNHTYYIVWYPDEIRPVGDWLIVLEHWQVLSSLEVEFTDNVITTFVPGPVVLEGHEFAVGTPWATFYSHGRVDNVEPDGDPGGIFPETLEGHRTYWEGEYGETQLEFFGEFWIRNQT